MHEKNNNEAKAVSPLKNCKIIHIFTFCPPTMPLPEQKLHYYTSQKYRVQDAHKHILAQSIPYNPCEVFDHFEVKEIAGYNMIKPKVFLQNYHNFNRQKYKMTSNKLRKLVHLWDVDLLGREVKTLPWKLLVAKVELEISRNAICDIIKEALGYGKRLTCVKRHQSDRSNKQRAE